MEELILDLEDLSKGIPALTPALGSVHAECASVCLEHNQHALAVDLDIPDAKKGRKYSLRRTDVSIGMKNAHNDLQRATEMGACGIAILLVRAETGLTTVQQARKGGGFDYWLAPADVSENTLMFQHSARLEVSGILKGDEAQFKQRVKQKLKQSAPSDVAGIPAYAVVVEFGKPKAKVAKR